jgi:hypothetical protein
LTLAANNSSNKSATNTAPTPTVRDNTVSGEPQAGGINISATQEKDRGEKSSPASPGPRAVTLHRQVSYFLPQHSQRPGEERSATVSGVHDAGVVTLHVLVLPGDFKLEENVRVAQRVPAGVAGERAPGTWTWPAGRG